MFLSPIQVLGHLKVNPGMRVADFGAGKGEYSLALSDLLKGEGSVYSFEIHPDSVEALHRERNRRYCENFYSVCTDLNEHIPLKDDILNASVLVNTLHQIRERSKFLSELNRVTKSNGRVLFVDWVSSFKNMGPAEDSVITPGEAVRLFRSMGFEIGEMLPAGTHHFAFIAKKI